MKTSYCCTPTVVTFSTCMTALANAGLHAEARALLHTMEAEYGVSPNAITYGAAITACAKAGERLWEDAIGLLADMIKRKLTPSTEVYNATITTCEKSGEWEAALNLLRTMETPTAISYNAAISACCYRSYVRTKISCRRMSLLTQLLVPVRRETSGNMRYDC